MPTANELYRDALLRHATNLQGYEEALVERVIRIINATERDLVAQLTDRLEALGAGSVTITKFRRQRLEEMLARIRDIRRRAWTEVNQTLRVELTDLAREEAEFVREAFEEAVQIENVALAAPTVAAIRAAAMEAPFRMNSEAARTLAEWMASLREADQRRLEEALRIGYLEGEDVNTLVRRVRGTRANRYRDGLLQITRRQVETVVRTAVSHFANSARDTVWEANADVILGLQWVSTLDGRTTDICRARDGKVAPLGNNEVPPGLPRLDPPNARPPAHANCRSVMVAIVSPEGVVGRRPFVVDTRTGRRREIDFRRMARQQGRPVSEVRREWARQRVGQVPAKMTYEEWLRRQDVEFQNEVLGPTRAKLFREGGLSMDDFVTNSGRRYSLQELRRRDAEAFRKAGVS